MSHTPVLGGPQGSRFGSVRALEQLLYTGPFVVIDAGGRKVTTAASAAEARALCSRHSAGVSVVGTLVGDAWAVDVDPADSRAEPVLGDVVAELLVRWATGRNVPWLARESGRPGGRHLVVLAGGQTLDELRQRCREVAAGHGVSVTVRKSLRLLTAPHRLGLPAPVIGGTLTAQHLAVAEPTLWDDVDAQLRPADRRTTVARGTDEVDVSPSAREYGRSFYLARAGYSSLQAWEEMGSCQVTERGFDSWLWYMWFKVVTIVAAEEGVDEDEAWQRAQEACGRRADALGRSGWRTALWEPALVEAATDRPRRWTAPLPDLEEPLDTQQARHQEVEVLRAGLRAAAAAHSDMLNRQGQLRQTMAAFLDVLADAIARGGRVSIRRMAEDSATARSTVQLRRDEALKAGLIRRVATHREDGQPCDIYAVGQAAESFVEVVRSSRYRSCTPPTLRASGTADVAKMRLRHQAEREVYSPPAMSPADTEVLEQAYPDPRHHAHAVVRSRQHQRRWWAGLSEREQDERRGRRREQLDRMPADDRARWLDWLARRDLIDRSIDHLLAGTAVAADRHAVEQAPLTIHHGRQDPAWRSGGTPPRLPNGPSPHVLVQAELGLALVGGRR